jgi:hypothetical protein
MERGAAVFAAMNPNVKLVGYQGTAAQQKAERVAANRRERNLRQICRKSLTVESGNSEN